MSNDFFSSNASLIELYISRLKSYAPASPTDSKNVELVTAGLDAITSNVKDYDSATSFVVNKSGQEFLRALNGPAGQNENFRVLFWLARFIREKTLKVGNIDNDEQRVLNHFTGMPEWAADTFDGYLSDAVRSGLPYEILSHEIKQAVLTLEGSNNYMKLVQGAVCEISDKAQENINTVADRVRVDVQNIKDSMLGELNDLDGRIAGYKELLVKLSSDYNFVSLSHAFSRLISKKRTSKWWSFAVVVVLGGLAAGFPVWISLFYSAYRDMSSSWSPNIVIKMVSLAGVEIILLYYFRIALRSYLQIASHITNLQLRLSICAFIEGYRDFSHAADAKGASSGLERFEALIFAQLPTDQGALPATIDGLEQLVAIAQAVKK